MLAVLAVVFIALRMYTYIIIASAILSWLVAFNVINTHNRLVYSILDFLHRVTEPALRPIRRLLPDLGGIDISPVVLILFIFFLQEFLRQYVVPAVRSAGL